MLVKYRPLILAFVCCFALLPAAPAPLYATVTKKKKTAQADTDDAPPVHRRHHATAKQASASAARPAKKTLHRTIPATTQDEDAAPVNLGPVDPTHPPAVHARAVIVIDAHTGEVLYEKNADEPRPIASTTKLLTSLIIAESGNLKDEVTVEPIDTICEPTKLYFRPGEHYARGALLYALLVHSCNDVARCLARDNAGSIESFANRMNARAASLGAENTRFVNPNGLPSPGEDQHSTARDLSKIARVVYGNPVLRPIMATQHLQFQYADGRVREFANTNRVLLRFPLCNGMKTGYTDAAGHCLVSSADDGNHAVISVCLGDNQSIWNDSQRLLTWGLAVTGTHGTGNPPGTGKLNDPAARASDTRTAASAPAPAADPWTTLSKAN